MDDSYNGGKVINTNRLYRMKPFEENLVYLYMCGKLALR